MGHFIATWLVYTYEKYGIIPTDAIIDLSYEE